MTHKICFSPFDHIPMHCHFGRVFAQVPNFGCNAGAGLHAPAVEWMAGLILGMITPTASGDTNKTLQAKHTKRLIFILIQRAASSQVTPTSKGTVIKMESFALWQARVAENKANDDRAAVLFLAYQSVSESQAIAAGLELVGTTWDVSGVQVKAYKPKPAGALQYGCVVCGVNSKHYQGMYCCGKKRVAVS